MAELALVLPLLLMIVFGVIEFSIAFSRASAIEAAARSGARLASVSSTSLGEVNAEVINVLGFVPNNISVSPGTCDGRQGQPVTVTVTHPHQMNIPFVPIAPQVLTGSAVFRCEA